MVWVSPVPVAVVGAFVEFLELFVLRQLVEIFLRLSVPPCQAPHSDVVCFETVANLQKKFLPIDAFLSIHELNDDSCHQPAAFHCLSSVVGGQALES